MSNLNNSKPFVRWYAEPDEQTVTFPINGRCLILCRHSGGNNYSIGLIFGDAVSTIVENGSAFSFKVNQTQNSITVTSTVQYWYMGLI